MERMVFWQKNTKFNGVRQPYAHPDAKRKGVFEEEDGSRGDPDVHNQEGTATTAYVTGSSSVPSILSSTISIGAYPRIPSKVSQVSNSLIGMIIDQATKRKMRRT